MARKKNGEDTKRKTRRAMTPEARENQLIAKAYDLAEERIDNGTATSQELTHFLKLGTEKARLENEKLRRENDLLKSKKEVLDASKRIEELYSNALTAMRTYSGNKEE